MVAADQGGGHQARLSVEPAASRRPRLNRCSTNAARSRPRGVLSNATNNSAPALTGTSRRPWWRVSLNEKVKTALDETRLLILGAQVLFGFQFHSVFQEKFAELAQGTRYVNCAGQVLMALAIGLLIAPSMQHRIVEDGQDTLRIHRAATVFAGMALLPFEISLGLGVYVVFDHALGAGRPSSAG